MDIGSPDWGCRMGVSDPDARDRRLGLFDEDVQLGARPNVEPPEPLVEVPEVLGTGTTQSHYRITPTLLIDWGVSR